MQVEISQIRDILMEYLTKARNNLKIPALKKSVRDQQTGFIQCFEVLNMALVEIEKKGDPTMEPVKIAIGKLVKLEEIEPKTRGSIDSTIIEAAETLKAAEPGSALPMELKDATWNSFSNRVYFLRKNKVIPQEVLPRQFKTGKAPGVYLVKYPKDEVPTK